MRYVWLTNIIRSQKAGFEPLVDMMQGELEQDASVWEKWLADKAIGEPQSTEGVSVDQLKAQGYVGVYKYVWS